MEKTIFRISKIYFSKSLNFYNLFISTIAVLDERDSDFKSVSILREIFCSEYIKTAGIQESLNDIIELFDFLFDKACDREIILGSSYKETYFPCFRDIDLIGLDSYMSLANHYASVILQKFNEKSQNLCKKNKNFETN